MGEYRLGEIEMKFAEIIWNMEPVQSGALAKEAEKDLGWKKSTTYTVLKRLCERGIFQNDRGTVTSCLTRREFQARQSEDFVEETFGGSLPNFVAAFVSRKKLSEEEIMELKKIIEEN